ncbi:hypothetical protein COV82_05255 [Candidatus Peregrinibacteria bacterium CG11_big_fil_rev_8_21_14_0_20_46_8]|nr:MAG: hypothetical protein COV82_05255 [Candidatus Peregrinibacteria bacterium CG11_big_fil_rev_8_21_14_0_20_46_8]
MGRFILLLVLLFEIFTFANRGGGPLFSHLLLTGTTFIIVLLTIIGSLKFKLNNRAAAYAYLGFFVFFLLSLLVSRTPSFGLNELLLFGNVGILFFIISNLNISEREAKWFAIGVVGIFFVNALIGYFVYIYEPFPRFVGTFIDLDAQHTTFGNDFANAMLLVFPLSLWLLIRHHARTTGLLISLLSSAVLLSALLLGFSRGAWAAGLTALVLFAGWQIAQHFRHRTFWDVIDKGKEFAGLDPYVAPRWAVMRILAAIFLGIILVNGLQMSRARNFDIISFFDKATFQADEGSASVSYRWEYWRGAAKLIAERPIFGHGVWSFRHFFPKHQETFGIAENHPHNLFLKIGVENGLPAALFFALFIGAIGYQALPILWRQRFPAALFFFLGPLAAFGHNLLDFNFVSSNFTLFVVLMAVGVALLQRSERSQATPNYVVFCMAASTLLFALALFEGYYNVDFKLGRGNLEDGEIDRAIHHLERAEHLIFERDRADYLAQAYRAKYRATNSEHWRDRAYALLNEHTKTTVDAQLLSHFAELAYAKNETEAAQMSVLRALELDPKNHFKYYNQALAYFNEEDAEYRNTVSAAEPLLEEYWDILNENRQHTILTNNPHYAIQLHLRLGNEAEAERAAALWSRELGKFTTKFGAL